MDSEAQHQLGPGTVLAERYRIETLLGEGGMGAVYRASHVHMHKAVAIKVLHPSFTSSPEVLARFEREAVAAANIDHPNVAHATDFGKLPDGSFYLVLEHVDGESLRTVVDRGPLEPRRALGIVRQIVLAIGAAHAKGIVHRDLKPENVMLVQRAGDPDFVKVLDFGIAKVDSDAGAGEAGSARPLTRLGAVMGTPDYMPPEQALGQPVDHRADFYSLGIMLFELLTGSRPFQGGLVTVMREQVTAPVPPLPPEVLSSVDPRVESLLRELLAKSPESRPESAAVITARIEEILAASGRPPPSAVSRVDPSVNVRAATMLAEASPVSSRDVTPASVRSERDVVRRRVLPPSVIAAAIAGLVISGAFVTWALRSPPKSVRAGRSEASQVTVKDTYAPERAPPPRPAASSANPPKKCNTRLPVIGCID